MFGAHPQAAADSSLLFVAAAALDAQLPEQWRLRSRLEAVESTRSVTKADLPHNDATPDIRVDPDSFAVHIDGELVEPQPVSEVPMAQRYFLF
jgi:urease subunit alpha